MNGLSFLAGARKNYPNLVYLRAYPQGIPEDAKYADYSDFQVKLFWDINSNHRVTIQSFGSKDLQAYTRTVADFENSERKDSRPPIGLNRNFRTDGARYIFKTNKFRNTLSYSKSAFSEFYEIKVQNPLTAETIFGFNNVTLDQIIFAENKLEGELVEDLLKMGYQPHSIYNQNEDLKNVLDWLTSDYFTPGEKNALSAIPYSLLQGGDPFLVLADYEDYCKTQERVAATYEHTALWAEKAILNTARMGYFSSDRTIQAYAESIWKLSPLPVPNSPSIS